MFNEYIIILPSLCNYKKTIEIKSFNVGLWIVSDSPSYQMLFSSMSCYTTIFLFCPLYKSVHSLYICKVPNLVLSLGRKFLTQAKVCFNLLCLCTKELRALTGLRPAAWKECWRTPLSTLFSCVPHLNPERLGFTQWLYWSSCLGI